MITPSYTDALERALGAIVAKAKGELALIRAQTEAALASARAHLAEIEARRSEVERQIADRLAAVRDGEPGRSVTVEELAPVVAAEVEKAFARLRVPEDGRPGRDADEELVLPIIAGLVQEKVAEAVASLPPAVPGRDADPAVIAQMVLAAVEQLPPAVPGRDADPEMVRQVVRDVIAEIPAPRDGKDGFSLKDFDTELLPDGRTVLLKFVSGDITETHELEFPAMPGAPGQDADPAEIERVVEAAMVKAMSAAPSEAVRGVIASEVAAAVRQLPPAPGGKDADPAVVADMVARAVAALPAPECGPTGPEGPMGRLPAVKAWADRVYYEREVVTHEGATYQATRDTGRAPPHDDWQCIARAGRDGMDGRSFDVRGTFDAECKDYRALNVVALGGAGFVARRDNPGICPGDGWQLISAQGKRGQPGEPGKRGEPGPRGPKGESVIDMAIDGDGLLTLRNGDGSVVECDLYDVLAKLQRG